MKSWGRKRLLRVLVCLAAGVVIFVFGTVTDAMLLRVWPSRLAPLVDDIVIGVIIGGLIWGYEEWRQRAMIKKLAVVAEMNHIVRNELEIIEYSAYVTRDQEHIRRIRSCVAHIDRALREVLSRGNATVAAPEGTARARAQSK